MFILQLFILFCVCAHSRVLAAETRQRLTLKEKKKPHQTRTIINGADGRNLEDRKPTDANNTTSNATRLDRVKDLSGTRRQFGALPPHVDVYPHQPISIHGPLHHVHYLPRPYPVVSVRYVPKPLPIPYAVPSQVHVSHLHLRPKCE